MAKILTIEIGHSVIKVCEMDYKVKKPKIYQCQEGITPDGSIADGYIVENRMRDLIYAVRETIARNGIKTRKVIFTVASSKIITREVTVPAVKEAQIPSVVQANLGEYFPVSLADYEVTQSLVQTIPDGPDAGKHRVMVFAAEKNLISSYKRLAEECDLELVNVCCSGASIIEAARGNSSQGCQAIIKIEEKYSIISVLQNGVLLLQRTINYGVGEAMREIIVQPSFATGDTLAVWRLITRQNCTSEPVTNTKDAGRPEAREAVTAALNPLLSGIMRVFDYFNSHFNDATIEDVSIIGLGAQFIGVPEILGEALGIVCKKAGLFQDVETYDTDVKAKSDAYFSCIGAGFATDGFVHESSKGKITLDVNYPLLSILVGVLCVALSVALFFMGKIPYDAAVAEKEELEATKVLYEEGLRAYERRNAVQELFQQVQTGDRLTRHANDGLLEFLTELCDKMPYDIEVSEFTSNDQQCIMKMVVDSKETAAKVLETLRGFDSLMVVSTGSLKEVEVIKDPEEEGAEGADSQSEDEVIEAVDPLMAGETKIEFTVVCRYYPQ